METIKGDITSGDAVAVPTENPAKAEDSQTLTQTANPVTKNAVLFGSQTERLEILQQAVSDYQKSGGMVAVSYRKDKDALVIVLVSVGQCVDCGAWFSGNDGCGHCAKNFGNVPDKAKSEA